MKLRDITIWLYDKLMLWVGMWEGPLSGVTFEPGHVLLWAWQEVKGDSKLAGVVVRKR